MNEKVNIGLEPESREAVARILDVYLSDLHVLAAKVKAYHWNIIDVQFFSLHEKLDDIHEELLSSVDDTAERIRAVGVLTPVTLKHYLETSQLSEDGPATEAGAMFDDLQNDYETIIRYIRESIPKVVDEYGDEATADFLIGEMADLEKTAWMIRSMNV